MKKERLEEHDLRNGCSEKPPDEEKTRRKQLKIEKVKPFFSLTKEFKSSRFFRGKVEKWPSVDF